MSARCLPCLLLLLVVAIPSILLSAPVLGNLSRPLADEGIPVSFNTWQASSFQIGDTAISWTIERVRLSLTQSVPNASLTLLITGQSGFRPNLADVRVEFQIPDISDSIISGASVFEAKNSPAPVLLPNQTYWLVLGVDSLDPESASPGGLFEWSFAQDSLTDNGIADGWSFGTLSASSGTAGTNWQTEATTPFTMSVEAYRNLAPMTLDRWRQDRPDRDLSDQEFLTRDTDQDGLNGLLEYAFDGEDNYLPISIVDPENDRVGVSYVRWSNAPELAWHIEQSTDLNSWTSVPTSSVATSISFVGQEHERVTLMVKEAPERVFLRVRVSR